jgi:hypothetical protein
MTGTLLAQLLTDSQAQLMKFNSTNGGDEVIWNVTFIANNVMPEDEAKIKSNRAYA